MGKFDRYEKTRLPTERPWKIHPIWRGIGCLMLILIPIVSYAAADIFLDYAPGWGLFPRASEIYSKIDLNYIVLPISLGQVIFTILFMVMGFVIFTTVYAFVYRVAGPPKYGPTDAPPPRRVKKRRR
jgi:hypothetical protein